MINKYKKLSASILSGLLLYLAWPVTGIVGVLFFAWTPLLFVLDELQEEKKFKKKVFSFSYLTFFIWNAGATWWIWNASAGGALMSIICNSLLMALVFMFFAIIDKKTNNKYALILLPAFWISFEWLHHNWDLTWPWLTLGNAFANSTSLIQWYEYTGPFGGSLWVLLVNQLFYKIIKSTYIDKEMLLENKKTLIALFSLILIPILLSKIIFLNYQEKTDPINVVVVQPNIDPYNEKFTAMTQIEQLTQSLRLASSVIDASTEYVITPETTLPYNINESYLDSTEEVRIINSFLKQNEKIKLIMGISTLKVYEKGVELPPTARKFRDAEEYYDYFNTVAQFDSSKKIQLYHKSRLVPGVEKMPFPKLLKPLENFALEMGGTSGSLGVQEERAVFYGDSKQRICAPVICYESIYGDYIGEYIRKGAQFIFVITNDGWWGDTPGYKQHLNYARLAAISHRRSIARSANTGTSCIINQSGEISNATEWWTEDVFQSSINANSELTIYSKYGDVIAYLAILSLVIIILLSLFKK